MRMLSRGSVLTVLVVFLIACAPAEEPIGECVTPYDCGDGYTCEEGVCIELPDDGSGSMDNAGDKDTVLPETVEALPETETFPESEALPDEVVDEQPDETVDEPVDEPADGAADIDETDIDGVGIDEDTVIDADISDDAVDADMVDETVDVDNSVPVDECVTMNNPCDDNGDTAATCADTTDSYTCACSFGFNATGGSCMDIDECTLNTDNCHTNAICTNTVGLFTCACNSNYSGDGVAACDFCGTDLLCGAACTACDGGALHCKDNGNGTSQCVACTLEEHCAASGGTPHCLLTTNTCVACRDSNDCNTGAGETCNPTTHVCGVNICGDGVLGGTIPAFVETFEGGFPAYAENNSYGTNDWATSTTQKHGGTYSLRSGNLYWADDYSSVFMNKYTDGQICFWHRSDSIWYGEFEVFVDGSSKYSKSSSQTSWIETCVTTSAGYRMLEFRFTISDDMGSGYWYVDDIRFYNATVEQCDGGTTTCGTLGFDCGSTVNCAGDCTWGAGQADCHDEDSCGDC